MRKTAEGGYYYILQDTLMMLCIFQRIRRKFFTTLKIYTLKKVLDIHNSILGMLMLTMQGIM